MVKQSFMCFSAGPVKALDVLHGVPHVILYCATEFAGRFGVYMHRDLVRG